MSVPNNHSISAEHRRHDRLLVARFAVGDAGFGQDHEAVDLVRRCNECAALAADIAAISSSVAKLPAAPRPRDFRLTTEQAERLRGSRLDRWLRTITGSGWATVRPIAAVALSVGMVMSVVGVLPILGAAAPAPAGMFDQQSGAANSPGQTTDTRTGSDNLMPPPGSAEIQPGGVDLGTSQPAADAYLNGAYVQPSAAVEPQPGRSNDFPKAALPGTGSGVGDLLLQAGLAVSVLALAVLALLYAARRRYYDPLLR